MFRTHVYILYCESKVLFRNAICILLLICSKNQPGDDFMGSKHVAIRIYYKVVFDGYCLFFTSLFTENCFF